MDSKRAVGDLAERLVARYLEERGIEILARNVRVGRLELDIVAREDAVILVVEVRTRGPGSYLRGLDSIDAQKASRVRRAGTTLWRQRFANASRVERMRFDAASVVFEEGGEARIDYVRAAF